VNLPTTKINLSTLPSKVPKLKKKNLPHPHQIQDSEIIMQNARHEATPEPPKITSSSAGKNN
jgi:hypothetical protein